METGRPHGASGIGNKECGCMAKWLYGNWYKGAGFMAGGFLALLPLLAMFLPAAGVLLFLHTPAYMAHQAEENAGDGFRRFVNGRIFGGQEGMTETQVLVVNMPVVWGFDLLALYAGVVWGYGWALGAPWFMLINAVAHVATWVRFKTYNPGLASAVLVFVPLSVATLWVVGHRADVTLGQQALGVAIGLGLHAAFFGSAFRHYQAVKAARPGRAAGPEGSSA